MLEVGQLPSVDKRQQRRGCAGELQGVCLGQPRQHRALSLYILDAADTDADAGARVLQALVRQSAEAGEGVAVEKGEDGAGIVPREPPVGGERVEAGEGEAGARVDRVEEGGDALDLQDPQLRPRDGEKGGRELLHLPLWGNPPVFEAEAEGLEASGQAQGFERLCAGCRLRARDPQGQMQQAVFARTQEARRSRGGRNR